MPNFLKEHPIAASVGALGGVIAVVSAINDAYSLVKLGLPNGVWTAIGLIVFFISTAAIVVRQHGAIQRTLPSAVVDAVKENRGKETSSWLVLFRERETLEQQVLQLKAGRPGGRTYKILHSGMDEEDVREEQIKRKERRIIELTDMMAKFSK